jgi:cytochrome c55X
MRFEGACIALVLLVVSRPAFAGQPDDAMPGAERQEELSKLLHRDCGSCHGLHLDGGLGPALSPERMRGYDREALVRVILEGVPGTAMPGWQSELSEAEARWLARHLQEREPSRND